MKPKTLLFVPMYNCERQIPRVLAQLEGPAAKAFDEVIVVDNRSPDGSIAAAIVAAERVAGPKVSILKNKDNYGLGGSHKVAFEHALAHGFDRVAVLHGDDQGRVTDLTERLARKDLGDLDCLLGARFHPKSKLQGYSLPRTAGNVAFNALFSLATQRAVYDLGAGLNLYSRKYLESRFFYGFPNDLTFNVYMLLQACWSGAKLEFFPISWREEDQISNAKVIRQGLRTLRLLAEATLDHRRVTSGHANAEPGRTYAADVVWSSGKGDGAPAPSRSVGPS
jgi:dolichol-phosphate mannosyltransferase